MDIAPHEIQAGRSSVIVIPLTAPHLYQELRVQQSQVTAALGVHLQPPTDSSTTSIVMATPMKQIPHDVRPLIAKSFSDTSPKFASNLETPPHACVHAHVSASMDRPPVQATPIKVQPEDWACLLCGKTETLKKRDGGKHCNGCGQKQYRKRNDIGTKQVSRPARYVVPRVYRVRIRTTKRSRVVYSAQEWECAMCKTRTTPKKRNKGALCNACGKRKRHAEHKDEAAAESLLALFAQ
jgi:hypothetical protein